MPGLANISLVNSVKLRGSKILFLYVDSLRKAAVVFGVCINIIPLKCCLNVEFWTFPWTTIFT